MVRKALDAVDGLRERKKQQTREAIVDAALDLFERRGFDATTVEDIAAAADVSPRTFFRYFDSKLDVVLSHNKAEDPPFTALAHLYPDKGPIEATRAFIGEMLSQLVSTGPSVVRELKVVATTPSLRSLALEHFHEHQDELAHAYATRLGLDPDDLKPRLLASVVVTTMWAVVERWVADGADPARLGPMIDEAFALLCSPLR